EEVVGCFVNLLPLRVRMRRGESFGQVLGQAREALLEGSRQEVPFEVLVERVVLGRGEREIPLVRLLLVWQGFEREEEGGREGKREEDWQEKEQRATKFDMAIFGWKGAAEGGERRVEGTLLYREGQIGAWSVRELVEGWQRQVEAGISEPETPLEQVMLHRGEELAQQQLVERNLLDEFSQRSGEWFDVSDFEVR